MLVFMAEYRQSLMKAAYYVISRFLFISSTLSSFRF